MTQPTAAFLWSLSPDARRGREGGPQGGQPQLLPMPGSLSVQGTWEWRRPVIQALFLGRGTRARVTAAGPWGQGDNGPLLHRLAGGQDSAGLCPCHRRGFGGKIQVVSLAAASPGVGDAGPPHCAVGTEPEGTQRGAASSLEKGQEGCGGCCSPPGPLLPPTGRHWEGRPLEGRG